MSSGGEALSARSLLLPRAKTQKEVSRRSVIRAVMQAPGSQQVAIAGMTDLSQAAVSSLVQDLQRQEVLRVVGTAGGRGNHVYLGEVKGVAVGIEVGHDTATVVTRRVDSLDIRVGSSNYGAQHSRQKWLGDCSSLIMEHTRQLGLEPEHIVSIGLGIPAAIDPTTAAITQVTATPDWDLTGRPADWFQDEFPDVPVIPDNDANLAAYGEHLHGAGRDVSTMLYVKACTGIGAGLVIDRAIYRGRHGLALEFGHLSMDPNGTVCRCGNRGCLETLVSGPRLLAQVHDAYRGFWPDEPGDTKSLTNLREVIAWAAKGDVVCGRVLRDAAQIIGRALAQVCNLMNPELLVLGGTLGQAADMLIEPATAGLREHALSGMFGGRAPCRIVGSELGELAGARGALALGLTTEPPPNLPAA